MFRTKTKTEQAREAVAARVETAASTASDASSSAQSTAADLKARAAALKDKAAPRVESAREAAENFAPKVQDAKDTFVDDVVPKLAAALATVLASAAAAKGAASEAAERAPDAYHVLKGDAIAKPQKRGGKGLLILGLVAAGAAAFAWKKSTEKKDPWATAGAYTPPAGGRDSSVGGHASASGASVGDKVTDLATAAKEKAAAAGSAVKDKAADVKDAASDKADELAAEARAEEARAAEFGGESTTETVTEGDAWTSAGDWADGSAPSTSGTSESSDLSTPHLDEGHDKV